MLLDVYVGCAFFFEKFYEAFSLRGDMRGWRFNQGHHWWCIWEEKEKLFVIRKRRDFGFFWQEQYWLISYPTLFFVYFLLKSSITHMSEFSTYIGYFSISMVSSFIDIWEWDHSCIEFIQRGFPWVSLMVIISFVVKIFTLNYYVFYLVIKNLDKWVIGPQ